MYDDSFYPLINLLNGNGIELERQHEERELAKALEDRGLVEQTSYGKIYAKLTVDGRLYVEGLRGMQPTDYSRINQNEVASKLDEILSKLRELGFGQQIFLTNWNF